MEVRNITYPISFVINLFLYIFVTLYKQSEENPFSIKLCLGIFIGLYLLLMLLNISLAETNKINQKTASLIDAVVYTIGGGILTYYFLNIRL